MLIDALCNYYNILEHKGLLVPEAYSKQGVSYIVELTPEGKIANIIDHRKMIEYKEKGKIKKDFIPKEEILPRRTHKSCIDGNVVEHRPLYIFGLKCVFDKNADKYELKATDEKNKAVKSHTAFIEKNETFFEGLEDPECKAFLNFDKTWDSKNEENNKHLLALGKDLNVSGFGFCLSGHPEKLLHNNPHVKAKWEELYNSTQDEKETAAVAQCGILGEKLPIAVTHESIKGVKGSSSFGSKLICVNNPSEESYGRQQSLNTNISEEAAKRYAAALNYLLSSDRHRTVIGDTTIIHWAEDGNITCDDVFNSLMASSYDAENINAVVADIIKDFRQGQLKKEEGFLDHIDLNVVFYVVGLRSSTTRLEVRFIYKQTIGKLIKNLLQHQQDLKVTENGRQFSLKDIEKAITRAKSRNKDNKSQTELIAKVLKAAINGCPYPPKLYDAVIHRIIADSDDPENNIYKITDTRIGIIKAYINRNNRFKGKKEVIKMTLDESNHSPAYLCGRLFSILESIQYKASDGKLNRTIKDSYFSSASSRPAIIFPTLIVRASHHMKKYEKSIYDDMEMCNIINNLNGGFPKTLSQEDRGEFMVGYYQQRQYTFDKIEEAKAKKEQSSAQQLNADAP